MNSRRTVIESRAKASKISRVGVGLSGYVRGSSVVRFEPYNGLHTAIYNAWPWNISYEQNRSVSRQAGYINRCKSLHVTS